jgi:hypothetical protein
MNPTLVPTLGELEAEFDRLQGIFSDASHAATAAPADNDAADAASEALCEVVGAIAELPALARRLAMAAASQPVFFSDGACS